MKINEKYVNKIKNFIKENRRNTATIKVKMIGKEIIGENVENVYTKICPSFDSEWSKLSMDSIEKSFKENQKNLYDLIFSLEGSLFLKKMFGDEKKIKVYKDACKGSKLTIKVKKPNKDSKIVTTTIFTESIPFNISDSLSILNEIRLCYKDRIDTEIDIDVNVVS
jgi:hypothetical protein